MVGIEQNAFAIFKPLSPPTATPPAVRSRGGKGVGRSEPLLRLMRAAFYYFLLINAEKLVED